jgi:hypothetical protein
MNALGIDLGKHDGFIYIAAEHRTGLWAYQSRITGHRTFRTGGQLPTTASAHSLLVLALLTGLRDISKAQAAELVKKANAGLTKPRILVTSLDSTFCDALQDKMRGQQNGKPLRAGKNFLIELARQLARFSVTFETDPDSTICYSLKNWAVRSIHDPKAAQRIPASLAPSAVSEVC